MTISNVSSGSSSLSSYYQQRKQDLDSLESAVQSGNLAASQQALTTLQQDQSAIPGLGGSSTDAGTSASQNPFQPGDPQYSLASMLGAIQSGDMSAAQSDLAAFNSSLQGLADADSSATTSPSGTTQPTAVGGGHHHHGGGHMSADASDTSSSSSSDSLLSSDSLFSSTDQTSTDPLMALFAQVTGQTSSSDTATATNILGNAQSTVTQTELQNLLNL